MVYIHNGILLHYKKEHIWVSSNEVDETGAYYTEWSGSKRESPIQYINAYIYIEICICKYIYIYKCGNIVTMTLYVRQQKRHRCKEQTVGFFGRTEDGVIWENSIETCILTYVK